MAIEGGGSKVLRSPISTLVYLRYVASVDFHFVLITCIQSAYKKAIFQELNFIKY